MYTHCTEYKWHCFSQAFLQFLKKVVANEGKNKMNLWNVSMIVAPNLFIYKGKRADQEEMQAAATTAHIVRLLIRYQDILWTVSNAEYGICVFGSLICFSRLQS